MTESLVSLLTALADDELVLGHRHSEWTGHAPHIEEDVAFSSIAQDEIGHATVYYRLIAQATGDDADRIALGRERNEYRHAVLCERPNRDWAYTLARHWLYDTADAIRLESLEGSADEDLAALVKKIRREERYHLLHAETWMRRVAHGPVEGRTKVIAGLSDAYGEIFGLFEPFGGEEDAVYKGLMPVPSSDLQNHFLKRADEFLDELGLPTHVRARPDDRAEFVASSSGDLIATDEAAKEGDLPKEGGLGGRHGEHSADFDELWSVMTSQYRAHPGATW